MALAEDITQVTPIIDYEVQPTNSIEWTVMIRPSSPPVSPLEIVSFKPNGGMEEGSNLCIFNDSGADIIVKNDDARGTAEWRVHCATNADITLPNGTPLWGKFVERGQTQPNGWHFEVP